MRSRFAILLLATAMVACSTVPADERGSDAAPIGRGEASDDSVGPALWRAQGSALVVREARVASPGWSPPSGHEMVSRPDRFEQRWRFDAREADGPLVVEVPIEGARAATVDDAGLHLVGSSGLWLHGHGTWVDAAGRRSHVPVEAGPLGARLVVPEAVLAQTRFPAWLDPIVSREPLIGDPPLIAGASPTRVLAAGFGGGVGVAVWADESPWSRVGRRLMVRRMDALGRPLDPLPLSVYEPYADDYWATAAFHDSFLIAWASDIGIRTRRLGVDGRWVDPEPRRLEGLTAHSRSSLVATSRGFLLAARSRRGAELVELDVTGAIVSRRRAAAERIACAGRGGSCLLAWTDAAGGSFVLRVDETGRSLDGEPRRVAAPGWATVEDVGYSNGSFLVVGTMALDRWGAVRVRVDGRVLDAAPIELPGTYDHPEVLAAPGGWMVIFRGRTVRVGLDGTVETLATPPSTAVSGMHAMYAGERWLVVAAQYRSPASVSGLALDGTWGAPTVVAQRYEDALPWAAVAANGSRYLVAWLESSRLLEESSFTLRTTALSREGLQERPPIALGPSSSVPTITTASDGGFVLLSGNDLWAFEADGALRSGPHALGAAGLEIGCASSGCLVRSRSGWTPFDPVLGVVGAPVADTTHTLVSGAAGHLDLWRATTGLFARRIGADGVPIDAAPIVLVAGGVGVGIAAAATSGDWYIAHVGAAGFGFSAVRSDLSVTTFRCDALWGHSPTRLSCGGGVCWLSSYDGGDGWLTLVDETGGVLLGPTRIAPEMSIAPATLDASSALTTIARYTPSLRADRLFAAVLRRDLADGVDCHLDGECTSGHCADGVCCDSACAGVDDCMACSVAAGAAVDGRCGAISAGWTCRESAGDCDVSESCDGLETTCPPDAHVAAGTTCRIANGPCDVPDACDGTSSECVNAFVAAGMICRASTDACDAEEACDGLMGLCEADWARPATEVCRASFDACDAVERCDGVAPACPFDRPELDGTACRDGDVCNGDEQCLGGACVPGTPLDCDDADWCSLDRCDAVRGCQYAPREPCCHDDIECDDSDSCTVDGCVEGGCRHEAREGCCRSIADCDDGDPCTRDQCIAEVCRRTRLCDRDAGPPPDAGAVEEPVDAGGARAPAGGGCACTAASSSASALSPRFLALALFAWLARARRRRRRAQRTQGIEPSS